MDKPAFDIGDRLVLICDRLRADGLIDSQGVLMEIMSNNGHAVMWETVEALDAENVLHPLTCGGFTLSRAEHLMKAGLLRDETGAMWPI